MPVNLQAMKQAVDILIEYLDAIGDGDHSNASLAGENIRRTMASFDSDSGATINRLRYDLTSKAILGLNWSRPHLATLEAMADNILLNLDAGDQKTDVAIKTQADLPLENNNAEHGEGGKASPATS